MFCERVKKWLTLLPEEHMLSTNEIIYGRIAWDGKSTWKL
jgi:hypothetical protein